MRLILLATLALIPIFTSTSLHSEEGTNVGTMMEYCQKPDGEFFKVHCYSYVSAVIDIQSTYSLIDPSGKPKNVCFPPPLVARQAAAVFVKWAKENPEKHHLPASVGIVESMVSAFPCKIP